MARRLLSRASSRLSLLRGRLAEDAPTLHEFAAALPSHAERALVDRHPAPSVAATTSLPMSRQRMVEGGDVTRMKLAPELSDDFGRAHTYLRISLTERCSLRCVYCMPEDGVELTPGSRLLSADETVRLARLLVGAGVNKIRLTGGEPTVRRDLPEVVSALDEMRPLGLQQIAMTSNGIALGRMLPSLVERGLDRLNLSLDTLDRSRFLQLTRRDGLQRVLDAIDLAIDLGLTPLKLNCVLMMGTNDDEVLAFAELSRSRPIDVRFIEYMPFDGNRWSSDTMMTLEDTLSLLRDANPGIARIPTPPHDVAVSYKLPGSVGSVSFIASMTQPFCSGCNRLRLTADGNLKVCLFGASEVSLRDAMREGASDGELLELVGKALRRKHAAHAGMHAIASSKNRPMTTIGG